MSFSYDRIRTMKSARVPAVTALARRGITGTGQAVPWSPSTEQRFAGHDFSTVRVHSGAEAKQANTQLRSLAYTVGNHIAFSGAVDSELLNHELTHVLQQRQATALIFGASAERAAEHVAASPEHSSKILEPSPQSLAQAGSAPHVIQFAPNQAGTTDPSYVVNWVRTHEGTEESPKVLMDNLSESHITNQNRYFYTVTYGWVDIRHFGAAASLATGMGSVAAETLGFLNEAIFQWPWEWGDKYRSGFSPEDIPSNAAGAEFGDDYIGSRKGENVADALNRWMIDNHALPANDANAQRASLPLTDPSLRGGADRGSSNFSRTQSTASGKASQERASVEGGLHMINDPLAWARMYGLRH